jgi:UDP-N-acetylglucosamine 2-epimerase (non-hydrolysing)/GDP/UDP-N,N'-diacetylbacillosamine 2-epimerase (hydrolysing)
LKKIAVVTGTRAEYGLLKPIILKILDDPVLELNLIVTGTHLSEEFGNTIKDIEKDKIPIKKTIKAYPLTDDGFGMVRAISKLMDGLVEEFSNNRPEFILILGDRGEPLAAAIVGAYSNIPIAHIHGGEVSGSVDESVRHAISKLATIHFPATQSSFNRLIKMGESRERIFLSGAPGLDSILNEKYQTRNVLCKKLNLNPDEDIIVLLQHPVTTEHVKGRSALQMRSTLNAASRLSVQTVIIYPNSDAGGREMISEIKKDASNPKFKIFENLSSYDYHNLLKHASILIGNSSSGIIEAPSFNLPVINIGKRQDKREHAANVIHVGHDEEEIFQNTRRILTDTEFTRKLQNVQNPYGDGTAAIRIINTFKEIKITPELLQKRISY